MYCLYELWRETCIADLFSFLEDLLIPLLLPSSCLRTYMLYGITIWAPLIVPDFCLDVHNLLDPILLYDWN